nr:MAG TPA: hypothetical protein [Caudoviricetes sp.]
MRRLARQKWKRHSVAWSERRPQKRARHMPGFFMPEHCTINNVNEKLNIN